MERSEETFKESEWGPILIKKWGLSKTEVNLIEIELGNLGREWDGFDVLRIMEEIGVEGVSVVNLNSKIGKMMIHEESKFKPFQRAGKGMRRIIFLGHRGEREGD